MGWHGPQQCDDNCCDLTIPSPCTKPIVTCRRTGGPHGAEKFFYTIENADEAFVEETCRTPYGGTTSVQHPITLTNGDATGEYYTQPNCDYCIIATSECGTSLCCDKCDQPICSVSYQLVDNPDWDFSNARYLDYVIATYMYANHVDVVRRPGADPVISASINGVSVFSSSVFASGTVNIPLSSLTNLVMVVTNDCGKQSTCSATVACCHKPKQFRISFALNDISYHCLGPNTFFGGTEEIWYDLTGMPSGTWLLDMYDAECRISTAPINIGEITFTIRKLITSGGGATLDQTEVINGTAYLQSLSGNKAGLGVWVVGTRTIPAGIVSAYSWFMFRELRGTINSGFPGVCGGVPQEYDAYFNFIRGASPFLGAGQVPNCTTSSNFFEFLATKLPSQFIEAEYIV